MAPGYGRIARYLKNYCKKLILVDLSPNCIEECKKKFANDLNIEYHVNDGKLLDMLKDNSIDFVFSFDAMVHVEKDVLESYIIQLGKKMTNNGIGFIQHSNVAMYTHIGEIFFSLRPPFVVRKQWRVKTISAKLFRNYCEKANLDCISQELINWGSNHLNDTFSTFTPKSSKYSKPLTLIRNYDFMKVTKYIRKISKPYNLLHPNE